MAKLAASSRLSLSDPRRSAPDVSWTSPLGRAAVPEVLAYGASATRVAWAAVGVARGYVLAPTVSVGVPAEPPDGPGRVHRLSPDAPDHSRGPGARG
ncbi:hypothetical protein PV341_34570 [Streptomyces sp. PA03-1a]|nr:hypothetical protein [Streptomyces sp. PA03-1a]MDX2818610.1 hypothetical protein [Streptomyces sp. PA03-5A]